MASNVIRRILVDHARRRNLKRGRDFQRVSLNETGVIDRRMDLVALNDAMNALERIDPRKVKVIEMRFFGGLSMEEIAAILEVSHITIKRDWDMRDGGCSGNLPVLPRLGVGRVAQLEVTWETPTGAVPFGQIVLPSVKARTTSSAILGGERRFKLATHKRVVRKLAIPVFRQSQREPRQTASADILSFRF